MAPPTLSSHPLLELETKIASNQKVESADISTAISAAETALKSRITDPTQLKEWLDKLKAFKDKLEAEKANLNAEYLAGRLALFSEIARLWGAAAEIKEAKEFKTAKLPSAMSKMESLTDPERDGEDVIDDYEGWSWFGEDENAQNETRWKLAGYLTAMHIQDPALANREYARAFEQYDESWVGDDVLTLEDLEKDMGLGQYIDEFKMYDDLQALPKGYLAGCLKNSAEQYANSDEAYRKYLFGQVNTVIGSMRYKEGENPWEKGKEQMRKLNVLPPNEWLKLAATIQAEFNHFQAMGNSIKKIYGLTLPNDVQTFMDRHMDSITNSDKADLDRCKAVFAAIAIPKLQDKVNAANSKIPAIEEKMKQVEAENNKKKALADSQIQSVKTDFDNNKKGLAGISIDAAGDFDHVLEKHLLPITYEAGLNNVDSTLDNMLSALKTAVPPQPEKTEAEKKEDEYYQKWINADMVEGRWKDPSVKVSPNLASTPMRDDRGKIVDNIIGNTALTIVDVSAKCRQVDGVTFVQVEYNGKKGWVDQDSLVEGDEARETKEKNERMEFLKDKNLKEVKGSGEYIYHLDKPESRKKDGMPYFDFKNPEVKRKFANKFNSYLASLIKKIDTDANKADLEQVKGEMEQLKESDDLEEVSDKLLKTLQKFLSTEEAKKIVNAILIMARGYKDSTMVFSGDNPPSLKDLKEKYDDKFVPAWEKAGAAIDKLKKGEKKETKKEGAPEGVEPGVKMDADIEKLLGRQSPDMRYAEASHEMIRYMKDPEKFPGGVHIRLPLNNTLVPAIVSYVKGNEGAVKIKFNTPPVKTHRYSSMERLMRKLHDGGVLWARQYYILGEEASYKQYEGYIGELDVLDQEASVAESANTWSHKLEFEWEGTDPDIFVRPYKHGRVQYSIDYGDVGYNGGDKREGYCENFNAFLTVMKHYRNWANRFDDIPDGEKALEAKKEILYDKIINPLAYEGREKTMGRVVYLGTGEKRVKLILDWGGGNDLNSRANAKVYVSVNEEGRLNFKVTREDLPRLSTSGEAGSFAEMERKIEKIKKQAATGKGE